MLEPTLIGGEEYVIGEAAVVNVIRKVVALVTG
jgi:hypothetical protein